MFHFFLKKSPPILLSQTYAKYGKKGIQSVTNTASSSSTTTLEQPIRKPKQPVNALYLVELIGITKEELQKNIDSLLGKGTFQIKWVDDNDAIAIPFVGSMQMNDLETLLIKSKQSVKDVLVSKGIVAHAELCWVNSKYEVTWREKNRLSNTRGLNAVNNLKVVTNPVPIDNKNSFEMLMKVASNESLHIDSSWDADVDNDEIDSDKQFSKDSENLLVNTSGENDIVDDWELLSDE